MAWSNARDSGTMPAPSSARTIARGDDHRAARLEEHDDVSLERAVDLVQRREDPAAGAGAVSGGDAARDLGHLPGRLELDAQPSGRVIPRDVREPARDLGRREHRQPWSRRPFREARRRTVVRECLDGLAPRGREGVAEEARGVRGIEVLATEPVHARDHARPVRRVQLDRGAHLERQIPAARAVRVRAVPDRRRADRAERAAHLVRGERPEHVR